MAVSGEYRSLSDSLGDVRCPGHVETVCGIDAGQGFIEQDGDHLWGGRGPVSRRGLKMSLRRNTCERWSLLCYRSHIV
jgi:hypothetical protein